MIVKLIAALVVMGICGVSASGVMAQQPAPKTLRIIEYQGDFTMLMAALPNPYGVTVGLELDAKGHHVVGVSLRDATITDVMNAMVQSVPTFQWQQTGEFIDVWPSAKSNPLLETRISSFNVKNLSPSEALINCLICLKFKQT